MARTTGFTPFVRNLLTEATEQNPTTLEQLFVKAQAQFPSVPPNRIKNDVRTILYRIKMGIMTGLTLHSSPSGFWAVETGEGSKPVKTIGSTVGIRIDREVYDLLESEAQGFENPNDVLRRVLGFEPVKRKRLTLVS